MIGDGVKALLECYQFQKMKLTSIQKNAEKEHLIPKTFCNESIFCKRITHIERRLTG